MSKQVFGLKVASTVFGLMSIVQLMRLLKGFDVVVAGQAVSSSVSLLAFFALAGLSLWLWHLTDA